MKIYLIQSKCLIHYKKWSKRFGCLFMVHNYRGNSSSTSPNSALCRGNSNILEKRDRQSKCNYSSHSIFCFLHIAETLQKKSFISAFQGNMCFLWWWYLECEAHLISVHLLCLLGNRKWQQCVTSIHQHNFHSIDKGITRVSFSEATWKVNAQLHNIFFRFQKQNRKSCLYIHDVCINTVYIVQMIPAIYLKVLKVKL